MGIHSQSRIVLLGENGNGKTTLVKLIIGDLRPTEGEIIHASGCRIALVRLRFRVGVRIRVRVRVRVSSAEG